VFTPVKIVRFWVPFLIFLVGAGMLVISPNIVGVEGAAMMVGGGLGVVVSNRIHKMGLAGEKDRDDEMLARNFMDRYGVWPDEASPEILDQAERDGYIDPRTAPGEDVDEVAEGEAPAEGAPAATTTSAHPHSGARRTARRPAARRRRPG
jgi:hypothetical protein